MKARITCFVFLACLSFCYGFCPHANSEPENTVKHSTHYDENGEHLDDYDHEAILGLYTVYIVVVMRCTNESNYQF